MGLDIRPGGASWSYRGFMNFRRNLAAEDGIDLDTMNGFGGNKSWDTVTSALEPLLDHSDCDGYIDSYDCETMIPRLRRVSQQWHGNDAIRDYDVFQLDKLIAGMEHCAEHGCALRFA